MSNGGTCMFYLLTSCADTYKNKDYDTFIVLGIIFIIRWALYVSLTPYAVPNACAGGLPMPNFLNSLCFNGNISSLTQ